MDSSHRFGIIVPFVSESLLLHSKGGIHGEFYDDRGGPGQSLLPGVGFDRPGRVSERKRLSRAKFVSFLTHQPPAEVVMEACGSAHYWARTARDLGHQPVLLAARRSKNPDRLQAWALRVQERRGHNRAAVALANKIARIAWAVWSKGTLYQSLPARTRATATN